MNEFNYSPEELKAMKNEYAKQATQQQFDLWIAECRNRGLVPVKDVVLQIRATKEWNPETRVKDFVKKAVHITTIQALRKLAERTGKYAGQLPSVWIYLDNTGSPSIESEVPLPDLNNLSAPRRPWAAKASVVRKGFEHPITVPARFEAYAQYFSDGGTQSLNSTWANRGPEQLEKCAEALALRKAFPEELGGLYLQEELRDEETVAATAQDESVQKTETPEPKKPVARKKKESVPDAGKPWGGEFESKPASEQFSNVSSVSDTTTPANAVTPENPITDSDLPDNLQGDRLPTDEEAKGFRTRLIAVKDRGFSGLGPWILKKSGKPRTNDIPFSVISSLVDEVEAAEKSGTLKELLAK
jgi:phage recombination protein Bet